MRFVFTSRRYSSPGVASGAWRTLHRVRRIPVEVQTPVTVTPEVVVHVAPRDDEDEVRNLAAVVEASHAYIAVQVMNASGYDAKLIGLLAFHGALIAAAVTVLATVGVAVPEAVALSVLLVFLVGASTACIAGLLTSSDPEAGPEPQPFYGRFGGNTTAAMLRQLVGDLEVKINGNTIGLLRRKTALKRSLGVLIAGALAAAAIVAVAAVIGALDPRAGTHPARATTGATGVTSHSP